MHSSNPEVLAMYEEDRQERVNQPGVNTPEYRAMRARDLMRRERVQELAASGALGTAEDYYHAAWIMNHGDTPDDARKAHEFALHSSQLGFRPARWLAAASYDRWQMFQGKPQKYGTNYLDDGRRDRLWDVDPQTTDEDRAMWDVPPLAEQLRKAEEANRKRTAMSEEQLSAYIANAPEWFQLIWRKWQSEENSSEKN